MTDNQYVSEVSNPDTDMKSIEGIRDQRNGYHPLARTTCGVCNDGQRAVSLNDTNILFLDKRIVEGTIDNAIDIARIAWNQFPNTREAATAGQVVEQVMQRLQEKMNAQVLGPVTNTTVALSAVIDRLQDLAKTNPSLIEQGFARTLEGFRAEIGIIKNAINEPSAKITELNQLVSQLVYKPIAKGNAGETILIDLWNENFTRDQIEKLGGAGREDLLVRPYLGSDESARFGDAISVERKTGKQKFTGSHREEAIRHAKEKGASIAMLVYDNQENLPASVKPVSISREQGMLVVVSDLQSGSWKMMRETIEIIQRVMDSSDKDIAEIDVDAIQDVVTELGNIVKLIDQVKGNSVKIKSCAEEIDQNMVTVKALVKGYQERLQAAVLGGRNSEKQSAFA